MNTDRIVAETLSPIERAMVVIIYSMKSKRVGIRSSDALEVLNKYLEMTGRERITAGSFNNLLKRLNTAGIIKLKTNRRAIDPSDYYRIYKKYPETILNAIFEIDEGLKKIQELCN